LNKDWFEKILGAVDLESTRQYGSNDRLNQGIFGHQLSTKVKAKPRENIKYVTFLHVKEGFCYE